MHIYIYKYFKDESRSLFEHNIDDDLCVMNITKINLY